MWTPSTEQEILTATDHGGLVETASFDAKSLLPAKGKSKDLAVHVAAMTSNGGTLLYGVGEDKDRRLTIPQPFRLAGALERVDEIVLIPSRNLPTFTCVRYRQIMMQISAS
jgi:hypothetical protein